MTIFDYLKDIIVTKKGTLPLDDYVPFLVGRWLSFINPTIATLINELNCKSLLENKEMHYRVMLSTFPQMKHCPKIQYIKKIKEDVVEEDPTISALAQSNELSKREIVWLMQKSSE